MDIKDFFEWLNYKIFKNEEDDPDLRAIECSLIRSMSEFRKVELSEIRISKNFDERFLKALEQEKNFSLSPEIETSFTNSKFLRLAFALLIISGFAGILTFLGFNEKEILLSSPAASLNLDPDVLNELREEFHLIEKIRDSDDVEALKILEKYNLANGITDRATRIHYTIELLSK